MYSLTQGVVRAILTPKPLGLNPPLPFPGSDGSWLPLVCGNIRCLYHLLHRAFFSLCLHFLPLVRILSLDLRPTLIQYDLISKYLTNYVCK